jgi:hypothetical protein
MKRNIMEKYGGLNFINCKLEGSKLKKNAY